MIPIFAGKKPYMSGSPNCHMLTRFILLAITLLLLGSCNQKEPAGSSNTGLEPVVAVGSQWYGHVPVWAGIERGIFARQGFNVEWRAA